MDNQQVSQKNQFSIPGNNVYENLELASHHEQVAHAVQNGLYCSGKEWYKARGLSSNG